MMFQTFRLYEEGLATLFSWTQIYTAKEKIMKLTLIKPKIGHSQDNSYHEKTVLEPLALGIIAALTPPDVEVVMYDARPDSPTRGLVAKTVLSEYRRRLMNIPAGIWHANRNIGTRDVVVVNFPTIPYDHAKPDKYRLPLDADEIPYRFANPSGW